MIKLPNNFNRMGLGPQAGYISKHLESNTDLANDRSDEPRVPKGSPDGGQWTSRDNSILDVSDKESPDDILKKKNDFLDAHLKDAQIVAKELNVPVANILGLAGLESGWGKTSRFAKEGNNYFSLHAGKTDLPPFSTGSMKAENNKVRVATFDSFSDSAKSFAKICGPYVKGVSDPTEFARILQDKCSYGINEDGSKAPSFVSSTAATIKGVDKLLSRRSA
jgi:hypothetical protein